MNLSSHTPPSTHAPLVATLAEVLALAATGCGPVAQLLALPPAVPVLEERAFRAPPPHGSRHETAATDQAEEDQGEAASRYAARNLMPDSSSADGPGETAEFLEWFFNEPVTVDLEEYLRNVTFEDLLRAALTSLKIPLGRNTTAELSLGLIPAGGPIPGLDGEGDEGSPENASEDASDANVFGEFESVFVGVDVPLPGRFRSRVAVDYRYSWPSEVDPDVEEVEYGEWTMKVQYRAWFW